MKGLVQRSLVAILVLAWCVPSASALAVVLHLESHHGAHAEDDVVEHRADLAELLEAATHGHRHDLEADRDHGHEVRLQEPTRTVHPGPDAVAAVLPALSGQLGTPDPLSGSAPESRRGPPRPLFEVHCALLI